MFVSRLSMAWFPKIAATATPCDFAAATGGDAVVISNIVERRDVDGNLMDIHDGNVKMVMYSTSMVWGMDFVNFQRVNPPRDCPGIYKSFGGCGFQTNHSVNLYTSENLVDWTFVKNILPTSQRPSGIYFRPKQSSTHSQIFMCCG